jgi:hypothetical protein
MLNLHPGELICTVKRIPRKLVPKHKHIFVDLEREQEQT